MSQLCKHRGEQIASVVSGCHACNGQPIYHCNLHNKRCCIPQRAAEESASRCCETCPDRLVEYREISCSYLKRGYCEAASRMSGIPLTRCRADNEACQICQNQ